MPFDQEAPPKDGNDEASSRHQQQEEYRQRVLYDVRINGIRQQQENRLRVLSEVSRYGLRLQYAPAELRAEPEIVLAAVSNNGGALKYASNDLKANPEIVKVAVSKNGDALRFASKNLQANPEIVKIAVSKNGCALRFASDDLKANPEIVEIAVSNDGWALRYAADNLKANPGIVKVAVSNNGLALKYALNDLHNDPVLVAAAVRDGYRGFCFRGRQIGGCLSCLQKDLERLSPNAVFHNEESVRLQAEACRVTAWQTIYPIYRAMQNKFAPVGVVLEYSEEVSSYFSLANKLEQLAPVIGAFAERGTRWRHLPQWLVPERGCRLVQNSSDDDDYQW